MTENRTAPEPAGSRVLPVRQQRAGVGVIVPCDMALDRELWRWAPEDVDLYVTRLPATPTTITVETVTMMGSPDLVAESVAALLPVRPEAVLYACTSGSFVRGRTGERALVAAMAEAGAAHPVTTSGALLAAVDHVGIRSVAIATPYDDEVTARLSAFLAEGGVHVVADRHLDLHDRIWTVPYDVTAQLIRDADSPEAEAIVVSCTNLPTYDVIAELEADLGKPVLTANQASLWAVLDVIGRRAVGPGQRLVETTDPRRADHGAGI